MKVSYFIIKIEANLDEELLDQFEFVEKKEKQLKTKLELLRAKYKDCVIKLEKEVDGIVKEVNI